MDLNPPGKRYEGSLPYTRATTENRAATDLSSLTRLAYGPTCAINTTEMASLYWI